MFSEGSACGMAFEFGWRVSYFNINCMWDFLTGWVT